MSSDKLKELLRDEDLFYEELIKVVEDTGWISDGKYQLRTYVALVKENNDDVDPGYYKVTASRSGSYYSDYEYYVNNVQKVDPYEETVTVRKWMPSLHES